MGQSYRAKYEAKETVYSGVIFRSRLEARWAAIFDEMGIEWSYEPYAVKYRHGRRMHSYWPDFILQDVLFLPYFMGDDIRYGGTVFEVKHNEYNPDKIDMKKWAAMKNLTQNFMVAFGHGYFNGTSSFRDEEMFLAYYGTNMKLIPDPLGFFHCPVCATNFIEFTTIEEYYFCPRCQFGGNLTDTYDRAYIASIEREYEDA